MDRVNRRPLAVHGDGSEEGTAVAVMEPHDEPYPVRYGFAFASLLGLLVSGEDDQIMTYGKEVGGFYVNPGKTLIIRIDAERPGSIPLRSS